MANPPITVGELVDVPAPESPINAAFHQEVAHRIVHRFASVAAMNAWAAANGSLAYVTANGLHYRRVAGAWTTFQTGDPLWNVYTPTVPSGGWPFANSSGRYMRVGSGCFIEYLLWNFASGGAAGGLPMKASLPFPAIGESVLGAAKVNYVDGFTNVSALLSFSGSAVTPFPVGDALGNISSAYTNTFPRPEAGGTQRVDTARISGWYAIG